MIWASLLVVAGLGILVVGGEILLRGAVGLAQSLRLTPAIIGLTIVAAGTSVPELAVSVIAGWRGEPAIAVGNVVGSNIFNSTMILGLGALVGPLVIGGNTIKLEYPVLVLVTLVTLAICNDGVVNRLDGVALLAIYVGFTAYVVSLVRGQLTNSEVSQLKKEVANIAPRTSPLLDVIYLAVSIGLLGLGADLTVRGASDLGRLAGLSEATIGLTIVAVGTGLPEVVTTVVAGLRGRDDIAIGNVIGSNLFNLLVILGMTGIVRPIPVDASIRDYDNWWMLYITLGLFPIMKSGMRISRREGVLLIAVYIIYITLLLQRQNSS